MEDQGWLAWFMIAMQLGRRVTVYGDGCQVRDVLFVDDLLDAYECAFEAGPKAYGRAYNIWGGPKNTLSLLDLMAYITERTGTVIPHSFDGWRPGDQKVFISDIRRAQSELGWSPKTNVRSGLRLLFDWVAENRSLFEEAVAAVA
jgi:CDP-paratose 2-epimerase